MQVDLSTQTKFKLWFWITKLSKAWTVVRVIWTSSQKNQGKHSIQVFAKWRRPNLFLFIIVEDSPLHRYTPNIFSKFYHWFLLIDMGVLKKLSLISVLLFFSQTFKKCCWYDRVKFLFFKKNWYNRLSFCRGKLPQVKPLHPVALQFFVCVYFLHSFFASLCFLISAAISRLAFTKCRGQCRVTHSLLFQLWLCLWSKKIS